MLLYKKLLLMTFGTTLVEIAVASYPKRMLTVRMLFISNEPTHRTITVKMSAECLFYKISSWYMFRQ